MLLTILPFDVLEQIFDLALFTPGHRSPALLRTNKLVYDLCYRLLYSNLVFSSITQLDLFASHSLPAVLPRSFSLLLPGSIVDASVFIRLHAALVRCTRAFPSVSRLRFHTLRFCLNSHPMSDGCDALLRALYLTDPLNFEWLSPDPDHHFSICIVPRAAECLFKAIASWSLLRHIKLCRLSFPTSMDSCPSLVSALCTESDFNTPAAHIQISDDQRMIPDTYFRTLPFASLHTVELNQVIFLDPLTAAKIACAPSLAHSLRSLVIVDAYQDSIWGPRVRISDVETAARCRFDYLAHSNRRLEGTNREVDEGPLIKCLHQIHKVVRCEAKVDRIMGGDRADIPTKLLDG